MNRFLMRLASLLVLLLTLSQCGLDKPGLKPTVLITSAEQLAADTSFIAAVTTNRQVVKVLFNRMRLLGSDKAREKHKLTIRNLIVGGGSISALAQEFGFADEYTFKKTISNLFEKRQELAAKYYNYASLKDSVVQHAYAIVVKKAEIHQLARIQSSGEVCELCHFNNCDECTDSGGGDSQIDQPGGSSGGVSSAACRDACQNTRISARNIAEIEVIGEFSIICPGVTWSATQIGLCLGPVDAAAGGVCSYIGCGSLAYLRYLNNLSIAENSYTTCVYGCR